MRRITFTLAEAEVAKLDSLRRQATTSRIPARSDLVRLAVEEYLASRFDDDRLSSITSNLTLEVE